MQSIVACFATSFEISSLPWYVITRTPNIANTMESKSWCINYQTNTTLTIKGKCVRKIDSDCTEEMREEKRVNEMNGTIHVPLLIYAGCIDEPILVRFALDVLKQSIEWKSQITYMFELSLYSLVQNNQCQYCCDLLNYYRLKKGQFPNLTICRR